MTETADSHTSSSSSVDLEAREIHDWVTEHGYLNAPMSERARRCIERLQAQLAAQTRDDKWLRAALTHVQERAEAAALGHEVVSHWWYGEEMFRILKSLDAADAPAEGHDA